MTLIELDDCRLRSDDHQWVIEKKYTKKKDGETYFVPESYHPSLRWAATRLLERTLRQSEADSLQEILELLKRIETAGIQIYTVGK